MNRQARAKGFSSWMSYGNIGFIEAAKIHANATQDRRPRIEVRDADEPDVIYEFAMQREVTYRCLNPRQGAE